MDADDLHQQDIISLRCPSPPSLIPPHGLAVLSEGGRKVMRSVIARDEIEVFDRCGVQGCLDGCPSGIGDGSGGKPLHQIGIIGSPFFKVSLPEIAVEVCNTVDNGRITLVPACSLWTVSCRVPLW